MVVFHGFIVVLILGGVAAAVEPEPEQAADPEPPHPYEEDPQKFFNDIGQNPAGFQPVFRRQYDQFAIH